MHIDPFSGEGPAIARVHEFIGARTGARAGLEVAKQLGRKGGRKPEMTGSKVESAKEFPADGVPPKDVAKNLGVLISTL